MEMINMLIVKINNALINSKMLIKKMNHAPELIYSC